MGTTIRLDDRLPKSAKRFARDTGESLTAVIENALRQSLGRRTTIKQTGKPVKLTTVSEREVGSGVDLNRSTALLSFMERPRGSF